jgi:deoxyribodipyrimidine photolyase
VPDKFIHAPWKFTTGKLDYSPPIVDHAQARSITLALFRRAGEQGKPPEQGF